MRNNKVSWAQVPAALTWPSRSHTAALTTRVCVDQATGLAMAHCRLAILDLSPAGHEPMVSPCGRFVLAYNGEIYNHPESRRVLGTKAVGSTGAAQRHVRLCAVGCRRAYAVFGVRSHGRKAALLRPMRQHLFVRLRIEGAGGALGPSERGGSGCPRPVSAAQLYARAVEHLKEICMPPPVYFVAIREGGCAIG